MAKLTAPIRAFIDRRWQSWLSRRIRPVSSITLDQKRIFIFPSASGFLFGGMLVVMLLTAVNYQNNSIYLLTFFLAGMFVIAIHATYANMAGLRIVRLPPEAAFAGEEVSFRLALESSQGEPHQSIQVGWKGQPLITGSLGKNLQVVLTLYLRAPRRGLIRPGRLLVKSLYPLGLLRTWTWVDLDMVCPVYPQPLENQLAAQGADNSERVYNSATANEELANIRSWREGDQPRRILWKAYARTGRLLSREYAEPVQDARWLDWESLGGLAEETRLSALAFAALDISATNREFGLRIPGETIQPDIGHQHLHRVLTALALYGNAEYRHG